jgi:Glycosyl hydrolases family 2, sugar binding domain/Glycosyl hydrolases family 2
MKYLLIVLLFLTGCSANMEFKRETLSLAGEWKFRVDSLDRGIKEEWYNTLLNETIRLPGSMAENGRGDEVTINTDWTGDIVDRSYFTAKKYEKYRQPGNIKIPFWLKPVKYYKGAAWYQKEIELPLNWNEKRIVLIMERCHWESTVFVNGKNAGSQNSLATPHEYDLTELLVPGRNKITIRINNKVIIPIGVNSHSISDHTQSNWNGITGNICLFATPRVFIDDVKIFPDIQKKNARVIVSIKNPGKQDFKGKLSFQVNSFNTTQPKKLARKIVTIVTNSNEQQTVLNYRIKDPQLWSEFNPALYKMTVALREKGKSEPDQYSVDFGMREFKTNRTHFEVNGHMIFLRGTLECCIFPLTGYPPSDVESWIKVLQTCKDYGLNHLRFHSWCPPEAAFIAADKLGMYFHIECSSWANGEGSGLGDGKTVDKFIYEESDRILKEYGNHPSFCMLAYGNEPGGSKQDEYLGKLINYWKAKDNRRVYTSGAGWPIISENDYNLTAVPRIQGWGEGLKSIINAKPPQTMFDYREFVSQHKIPTVSHEIGQWCVYPDFKEINKYTGVLKPTNFEIFRESLSENNLGDKAEDFLKASGKLQSLCYKADIEAAFRTPGFGGFQLLQLHDFPGQGTALVGILNPFFENKGYITTEEFRMFCNETVPLARIPKMTYSNNEIFKPEIEIAHFGARPLFNSSIICRIINSEKAIIYEQTIVKDTIGINNCIPVGTLSFNLSKISKAQKLTLEVLVKNTPYRNKWDFWAYPKDEDAEPGIVFITDKLDERTQAMLSDGGSVLLLMYGKVGKTKGAQVAIGFSSIFWNTAWTNDQPPHTLGILCDPRNPFFTDFPTEYHSNWQWWDPVSHSQAMILDRFPSELKPIIQPIDTWFENRRLALVFEAKAGGGKLMVCSVDLKEIPEERLVSKQLLKSMLDYMNSDLFDPQTEVKLERIKELLVD